MGRNFISVLVAESRPEISGCRRRDLAAANRARHGRILTPPPELTPSPRSEARGEGRGEGLLSWQHGVFRIAPPLPGPLLHCMEERESGGSVRMRPPVMPGEIRRCLPPASGLPVKATNHIRYEQSSHIRQVAARSTGRGGYVLVVCVRPLENAAVLRRLAPGQRAGAEEGGDHGLADHCLVRVQTFPERGLLRWQPRRLVTGERRGGAEEAGEAAGRRLRLPSCERWLRCWRC
jgi:hypothetical protein